MEPSGFCHESTKLPRKLRPFRIWRDRSGGGGEQLGIPQCTSSRPAAVAGKLLSLHVCLFRASVETYRLVPIEECVRVVSTECVCFMSSS